MMKYLKKLSLLTFVGILLMMSSCKNKEKTTSVRIDQGFQEYISAYTSGIISSKDVIRIRLTQEYAQDIVAGTVAEKKLFSFEPAIKGKTVWVDSRTIDFIPREPLLSGTEYSGNFLLKGVIVVDEKFGSVPLKFQVIKQSFKVEPGKLTPYSLTNTACYKYRGKILTADVLDDAKVEDLLRATVEGKVLKISWKHNQSKNSHEFEVENIKRKVSDAVLKLAWDGNQYGIDVAGIKEIEVPGLKNFKLISAQVYHQPSQYVLLTFSDPLKKEQNLKGLISVKKESGLKYLIEDNSVKVFFSQHLDGKKEIEVHKAIKNASGYQLKKNVSQCLTFEATKPNVRLIGKGVILPNSNGLIFPFEAVNLKAVDVEIVKIYESNIAQFLQINSLEDSRSLRRVGRLIIKKKIDLTSDNLIDYGSWNAFSFDLSELIKNDPGAIYKVEISFRKSYSLYPCADDNSDGALEEDDNWDDGDSQEQSYWDGCEYYYYNNYNYDWYSRDDPCSNSYYVNRKVSRNVLASNIGLIAKAGNNNELKIFATDIMTAQPLAGIEVEAFNYQQRSLGSARTDENGMATIAYDMKPFLLIAKNKKQRGYLKLNDGASLSLSKFDVGGIKYEKGIKGFIYGERGVWRPGDTIFLTFILEDKDQLLPSDHPVCLELINPYGKIVKRMIKSNGVNGFYQFTLSTKEDAPTGNWLARVKVGGAVFVKQVKVETVKPNRLKINIDFGKDKIYKDDKNLQGKMEVKWLHGAIAKNLEATVYMKLKPMKTRFKKYNDYVFDNPSVNFSTVETEVFDSRLDEFGKATISPDIEELEKSPGMLMATFDTKVFEEGGNFSINQISIPYAPYKNFVGIKVPKGDKRRGMLLTDIEHKIDVVTVNADGEPVSINGLIGKLYKIKWRWWWQSGGDNIGNYIERQQLQPIIEKEFSTEGGFGSFNIEVKHPDWGRYIVLVESPGGHSAGKVVYIDWPGWAGRAQDENGGGASMLTFSSDKESYTVGEEVSVSLPGREGGRALVSIEKGSRVVNAFWIDTQKEQTSFSFKATEEMSPNVYVHITALQAHGQTQNDLPIRMYGVIPIKVEDPTTKLQPVITMPDELRPESDVKIKISEENSQSMTFTLAVVNEGLLDLTNYKTPNPWTSFYAREALSVRTWDLYDLVLGAYGAKIESAFAIGGDCELDANSGRKAQRFKPVVKFFGPYNVDNGSTKEIEFTMPRYVGAVKAMVIAGNLRAYGAVDKSVPVRSPLMLVATLPRVLSPQEKVKLPVTLFVMDDKLKKANVKVKTNGLIKVTGDAEKTLTVNETGEYDFNFEVESTEEMGVAKVELIATSGKEKATYEIEMDIRSPNPPKINTYSAVIKSGETWEKEFEVFGIKGTNSATLEVSGMPAINLKKRLHYLISYPYGCIEQTTSSVFPQLYLEDIMTLDKNTKKRIKNNVIVALERLSSFQISSGGFSYWPGNNTVDEWGTNYAGHFLIEAEEKGYTLPIGMKSAWLSCQMDKANNWSIESGRYGTNGFIQAYRLYTLALAGQANLSAMNRLKECDELSLQGKYFLSMSYLLSGNKSAAENVLQNIVANDSTMKVYRRTYGSTIRDRAIILEGLLSLEKYDEAMPVIESISKWLNSNRWMSTQTTAFCLRAMCKAGEIFKEANDKFSYTYSVGDAKEKSMTSTSLINREEIALDEGTSLQTLKLKNKSKTSFYVNFAVEGTPLYDTSEKEEKNLKMRVVYKTLEGNLIDCSNIEQGKDFKVEITVQNVNNADDYDNLALSVMFPSGWEIINNRLNGDDSQMNNSPDYQDIRDDRVNVFFNLNVYQSKTFEVQLNASYEGEYVMPAIQCSDMYNNNVRARIPGQKVVVEKYN